MVHFIRRCFLYLPLLLLVVACDGLIPGAQPAGRPAGQENSQSSTAGLPVAVAPTSSAIPEPTADPPTAAPSTVAPPTAASAPTETAAPPTQAPVDTPASVAGEADLSLTADGVLLYPVPALFAGDAVTFQVVAHVPDIIDPQEVVVHILVDGQLLVNDSLRFRNLAGESTGLFEWVWDTRGAPGVHRVEVVLDPEDRLQRGDANPDNNAVSLAVTVQPAEARSPQEIEAFWLTRETAYARVHVVQGTAAARDFEFLITVVDAAIQQAARRLNETPLEKFDVYLIDRVIGQGGYAGSAMVVSYLDRDYAGDGLYEVLGHEAVHMIDRQIAPNRIPFLGEGVAVWATGGHYKQEDLARRTAALLVTGHYIPLADLLDDFYKTQHEIGYLEAAGLVQYLVDSAGWPRFRAFYAGFTVREGESASGAFAREVQRHYGLSLSQLEEAWLTEISQIRLQRQDIEDLQTTLRFYEIMRQYQLAFDPTAHFLQAWLPFPAGAHERGLTADFIRHPSAETNVTLETLLAAADRALRAGNYGQANVLLDSVERVVESRGAFLDPLAISYRQLVRSAARSGYEAQQIDLQGSQATMVATESGTNRVTQLRFQLGVAGWELAPMSSQ